jgi:hypothetical protein
MFAIINNGVIALLVQAGTPFVWDGVQYPANWCNLSTPEDKAAIGMVDVVYGQYPNDQYYWVSQGTPVYNAETNQVEVNYTATPKDLFECQNQAVSATNAAAYSLLAPTDYIDIRNLRDPSYKPEWMTWREDIRTQASAQVAAITACTTVDELAALPPVVWAHDPNYVGA